MGDKENLVYYHNMVTTRLNAAVQHLDNHKPLECRYALRLLQLDSERFAEYTKIVGPKMDELCSAHEYEGKEE